MTGAPVDSSIRTTAKPIASSTSPLPDSQSNLDPTPQLLMTPGSEQFSFQYDDGLGDGRDKYSGYNGAGGGGGNPSTDLSSVDFVTVFITKLKNQSYTVMFNIPFPVEILGTSFAFGSGPGSAIMPAAGTYPAGSTIAITLSGTTSASANFAASIKTRTHQIS